MHASMHAPRSRGPSSLPVGSACLWPVLELWMFSARFEEGSSFLPSSCSTHTCLLPLRSHSVH